MIPTIVCILSLAISSGAILLLGVLGRGMGPAR